MKVIIVEDEKLTAEHLLLLLKKLQKDVEVIGFYDTVKSVVDAFKEGLAVDLI
jgi:DNA-binding LytR/AlgR family response regulator